MTESLVDLMRQATRMTRTGKLSEATQAIHRAWAGLPAAAPAAATEEAVPLVERDGIYEPAAAEQPAPLDSGEFVSGTHRHGALKRDYKLYVPPVVARDPGRALPLVVMLHGCTQDPDDFAAGTGMNELARAQGFFVLYPAQAFDANPQRCWNWFKHTHQQRGRGEPGLIADLTLTTIKQHGIDASRVYVAGLSAGGAMAAIVAAAYPEIYAAVGVHSGLARGAASDLGEAMSAMRSGAADGAGTARPLTLPTIVFHGDRDETVHPRNGEQVIESVVASALGGAPHVEAGVAPQGRRYTRSTYRGAHGRAVAEHWLVHGAGHAWSGGQGAGSYTDGTGPDASAEMLRFFFAQRKGAQ